MEEAADLYVKCQEVEAEVEEKEIAERQLLSTSSDSDTGESGVSDVSGDGDLKVENGREEVIGGQEDVKHEEVVEVGKNVYVDKASAFSNGTSGVQSRGTEVSVSDDGSMIQSSKLIEETVTIQESRTIVRTQHKAVKDAEIEPVYLSSESVQANGSHHTTLDSTINWNGDVSIRNPNEQECRRKRDYSEEFGVIYEDDPEPIDYDVEGVLKKQETHDLICPNCYSCITRRVILKKRKRVLNDIHHIAKRDRIEETGGSEISRPDTVQEALDESLTNRLENISNPLQEVITCWSCFSLLIPSGKGFILFRLFGDRKQPKPEVISKSNSIQTPLLTSSDGRMSVDQGNKVNPVQLANGNMVEQKSNINSAMTNKGSEDKLFWSSRNNRDDNFKSSQQTSTSQTGQLSTSSEKNFSTQGAVNQAEEVNTAISHTSEVENSKQTNPFAFTKNGFHSVGIDNLTTHTQLAGKDKKIEAGPNLKPQENVASTIMHSHEDLQIQIDHKPNTEFDSFKESELFKSEDLVTAVQGSTQLEKLVTDPGKGLNVTAGSELKLWSCENNKDDNFKSSQQTSTSQTGAVNQVEEVNSTIWQTNEVKDSKQTNSLAFAKNGLHSIETDYLKTHTRLAGKDKKIEEGPSLNPQENVAPTIIYSPEEFQIKIGDKPNEFDSFKHSELFKSEGRVSAVQGSTKLDKLVTDSGKGLNVTEGSDCKLFWSYGNNKDDNFKSSQQASTSQIGQFSTSSEKTTKSQGAVNEVEEANTTILQTNEVNNSKHTNSLSFAKNGFHSVGTDYLTTHTQPAGKDKKIEEDPSLKPQKNVASTIVFSPKELQIKIDNKPHTQYDSFKDRKLFKSENIVSAVQGSTLLDKLVADLGKGLNVTADDLRISIENVAKQYVLSRPEEVSRDIVIPGTETDTQVCGREQAGQHGEARSWDILKSIVYGGLIESITGLGLVASAAGAETATGNVLV
uniref:Uncharacterized protein n=1 Tax=Kalanchoe fedtschenkoi TaxID=63787 RepID=A0A7N0TCC4_KALFE